MVMVEVFSLILGMSIPWCGKIGKGKFPQSSLKAHFIFPSHGLAVMVKKNFPSRGFAAPGEIFVSPVAAPPLLGKLFFTNPAKPFLGKIKCAFRDSWGNLPFPIFPHHRIDIPRMREKTSTITSVTKCLVKRFNKHVPD